MRNEMLRWTRFCRYQENCECARPGKLVLLFLLAAMLVIGGCAGGGDKPGPNSTLTPPTPGPTDTHSYVTEGGPSVQQIEATPVPAPAGSPQAPPPGATKVYEQDWTDQKEPGSEPAPGRVEKPAPVPPPPANDQTQKYIRGDLGN